MFGDDLNVRVTSSTADFSAGMEVAERGLSSVRSDALQTAGAMQMLQGRMDEAGDEAQTAGMKAGASSGGFLSAASGAATAQISFDSLSVVTTASLIPSLLALSTVMAPLLAAMGGFITVAGSIAGIGLAGFIGGVATNGEMLKETFNELVSTIKTEFAPVFDLFAVTLDALMQDLADIIPELVPAQTVIERMVSQFDLLGVAIIEALPAFVDLAVTLTQQFLPPFARWVDDVLPRVPGMLQSLIPVMLEVGSALGPMVDSLVEIAPTMTEFGMTVLNIVIPALTTFLDWWNRGMQVVNQMEQSVGTLTTKLIILGPIIASLATTLGGPLATALTAVGGLLGSTLLTGLTTLVGGLGTIATTIAGVSSSLLAFTGVTGAVSAALSSIGATVISFGATLSALSPTLAGIIGVVASATTSFGAFIAPITGAISAVGSLTAGLTATLGPIGLLLAAIGTLGWVIKNNQQVIARFANRAITLLQNVVRDAATWIQNNGPALIKKAFRAIGEGIRFVALDIYNATFGDGNSILKSLIVDFGSWLINKGPGILKSAIGTALDVIWAAAQGLYQGLIGNSLFPDMFADIAAFMTNQVPTMLANGAIKAVSTIFSIYQSGFNRIANFIASIWNDISQTLISGMETVVNNIVSGLNGVIQQVNRAIEFANNNVPQFERDTFGEIGDVSFDGQAANLQSNRTTDVGQLQEQNEQTIRVVLDEQTDVVEGRIEEGAERVVETRERRTQRNSGRNPNPR